MTQTRFVMLQLSRKRPAQWKGATYQCSDQNRGHYSYANIENELAIAMTIEIHRPELEALIMERMKNGGFLNVEDALMQALETSLTPDTKTAAKLTGADLIAAIQRSPYRDLEIEPQRYRMPVRDVVF